MGWLLKGAIDVIFFEVYCAFLPDWNPPSPLKRDGEVVVFELGVIDEMENGDSMVFPFPNIPIAPVPDVPVEAAACPVVPNSDPVVLVVNKPEAKSGADVSLLLVGWLLDIVFVILN